MAYSEIQLLNEKFLKYNKYLIFSPHPDDDVIGMGGTIYKLVEAGKQVYICYQTTGANAGSIEVRRQEAINAVKLLNVPEGNLIFADTPFYNEKRDINDLDIYYTSKIINRVNPNCIFYAGDVYDPNKTHLKCYNIIKECLKTFRIPSIKYYSAWYAPVAYEITQYFDNRIMDLKIKSILEHKSQLEAPVKGELTKKFYEVVNSRNKSDYIITGYPNNWNLFVEGFNY